MKKNIIFTLMVVLLLIGCNNVTQKDSNQAQSSAYSHSEGKDANYKKDYDKKYVKTTKNKEGQVFRVVSAYKWVNQYVEKAESVDSESKRFDLWKKIVMDHVQKECLSGVYSHLVQGYINTPPEDLNSLKSDIEILTASNVEKTTFEALKVSAEKLPGPDTTVCLFPKVNTNYAGVTLDAGKVSVFYSSSFSNIELEGIVAHEYHHSVWTSRYAKDYEWDLLGGIIFEGRAEYFATRIYGPSAEPVSYMKDEEERREWNKIKDSLHTTDQYQITTVLFGGKDGIPYNFGYIVGYHIVRDYVNNHPNISIEDLSKLNPAEIYENSGYKGL